jgi:CHAT domain-containing protein/tetratricopeptide (TPR) repeat protein
MTWKFASLLILLLSPIVLPAQTPAPPPPQSAPGPTDSAKPAAAEAASEKPAPDKTASEKPGASPAPSETGKNAGLDEIADARKKLQALDAAHSTDAVTVCDALSKLIDAQLDAHVADEETLAMAKRETALAEAIPGARTVVYTTALGDLAQALEALDRPAEARPIAEKTFDIAAEISPGTQDFADAADNLAFVCAALGDFVCAVRDFNLAIGIARKLNGPDPFDLAEPLSNLANSLGQLGDHAGAIAALNEALTLVYAKAPNSSHLLVFENNIGSEYSKIGDFDKAISHLNKAAVLARKEYGDDSPIISELQTNLAATYARVGQFDLSWKTWEDSIRRLKQTGFDAAQAHSNYARSLASGGSLKPAILQGLIAARLARENFALALQTLPERQALAYDRKRARGLDLTISVVAKHPDLVNDDIFQELIRTRAMVTDEMAHRQKNLNQGNDPEMARLLTELNTARSALLALEQADKAATPETITLARDKMERAERAVAERSVAFRNDERTNLVALDDVRRNLPAGSVLVSYVRYGRSVVEAIDPTSGKVNSYAVFVYHPDSGKLHVFDLGLAADIDALIETARKTVDVEMNSGGIGGKRNERAYRDAAGALRAKVLDPVRGEFGESKLILVVPDGDLNLIPFAALPDGDGYWLDHGPVIHLLSSERDLVPVERTAQKTGLVAIGNPAFNLAGPVLSASATRGAGDEEGLSCEEFNKVKFHPLPESAAEISDISAQWKHANGNETVTQFVGNDATRERFLEQAVRGRVLHVATHAFLVSQQCGDQNPLLHSGLVFAGANNSRETSLLTAQQIASIDLSGVDWAVLSACNTGGGQRYDGEGVLGLQRAFRVAGARSVILTLWPVDDAISRRYMHELYSQRFGSHATTADAVWNASRKLLADQRAAGKSTHPWYWAGFVGSGGWE